MTSEIYKAKTNIWRSASLAFSRNAVTDVIRYNDFSQLDWVSSLCPRERNISTYLELMDVVYRNMAKYYRCEYIYKNEIIKDLIKNYRKSNKSVVFNEFRVADSIVDLAIFNGESKSFEIKTEFDNTKRLEKQMKAYRRVFDKCYIVVPEEKLPDYMPFIEDTTGVITLTYNKGHICLVQQRDAVQNDSIDSETLFRCLRTKEYEHIVTSYYGTLPDNGQDAKFDACMELVSKIPIPTLKGLYLAEIKKRKSDLSHLQRIPHPLVQLCVSLNLKDKEINSLIDTLSTKIY